MKLQASLALVLWLLGLSSAGAQTSATPNKPDAPQDSASAAAAISPELIAQGDKIYHGPGNCYACHGTNAQGSVGPNLTDGEWIHSKGSYDELVAQITSGVPKEQAKSGIAMPPKGGGSISDEDVKAVAAYIYSLTHK
jgi:mono/diheme cytochrome c family protein